MPAASFRLNVAECNRLALAAKHPDDAAEHRRQEALWLQIAIQIEANDAVRTEIARLRTDRPYRV